MKRWQWGKIMQLREAAVNDKEAIIQMYNEYMKSELILGIDRFEGVRDFEKLSQLNFTDWLADLEKINMKKICQKLIHHIRYI